MDDMKDKVKSFMKKVNNPFSSTSSGKFQGQGRVLGSSSSGPVSPMHARPSPQVRDPKPNPAPVSSLTTPNSDQDRSSSSENSAPNRKPANGFDPFDSLVTSGKRSQNGYLLNVYECPICGRTYRSEEEVNMHVDSCANNSIDNNGSSELAEKGVESKSQLESCIGAFLSGKPLEGSVEVVLKLLRNIVREPENAKFRRIRMSNPKIREAIGEVAGGVELLECVGFGLKDEDGEMWAVMEVPNGEQIYLVNRAMALLEPKKVDKPQNKENSSSATSALAEQVSKPKKVDRQVRCDSICDNVIWVTLFVAGSYSVLINYAFIGFLENGV